MNKKIRFIMFTIAGMFAVFGLVFATTTITDTDNTFGGDITLSETDATIQLTTTEHDIFSEGQSIELKALDAEAKPSIGWYGYFDNGSGTLQYGGIGWQVCHYNSSINSDVHQHCSFEVPGADGIIRTRYGVGYGKEISDLDFFITNVNFLNLKDGVDLRFKEGDHGGFEYIPAAHKMKYKHPDNAAFENQDNKSFTIEIYSGPSTSEVVNNSEVLIKGIAGDGGDYLNLSNDGTDSLITSSRQKLKLSAPSDIWFDSDIHMASSSTEIQAEDELEFQPNGQTTRTFAIKTYNSNTDIGFYANGDSRIIVGDSLQIQGEMNITGVTGAGQVVCVKADGNLGTCTDTVNATGGCTCT